MIELRYSQDRKVNVVGAAEDNITLCVMVRRAPGACQSVKIRAHHIVGGIPIEQDLVNHS